MYISNEFKTAWEEWKDHKKEKYGMPYTSVSERKALSKLFTISHGVESLAIDSIDYSIEHNWSSIYIKPKANGQQITGNGDTSLRADVQTEFNKRYGGAR